MRREKGGETWERQAELGEKQRISPLPPPAPPPHRGFPSPPLFLPFIVDLGLGASPRHADPNTNAAKEMEEKEAEMDLPNSKAPRSRYMRILAQFASPVFLEAFVLTFLAEWGDRSQIATISVREASGGKGEAGDIASSPRFESRVTG